MTEVVVHDCRMRSAVEPCSRPRALRTDRWIQRRIETREAVEWLVEQLAWEGRLRKLQTRADRADGLTLSSQEQ